MKDIQEDVLALIDSISQIDESYASRPTTKLDSDNDVIVAFYELDNEPGLYDDGLEDVSIIYYNFDIYSKLPNTWEIREKINDALTEYGFVRLSGGTETRSDDYYIRLLSYRILL